MEATKENKGNPPELWLREKKVVKCITCLEFVEAELSFFGGARVGICPRCGKLAYSGK